MPTQIAWNQQCTGTVKETQKQCRRWAIRGGVVCIKHGGAAPQVKRKAAERLRSLVDPAITAIEEVIDDAEETRDKALQVRTSFQLLDRTGHGPTATISLDDGSQITFDDMTTDFDRNLLLGIMERARDKVAVSDEQIVEMAKGLLRYVGDEKVLVRVVGKEWWIE